MTDWSRHHRSHSPNRSHLWFGIIAIIAGILFTLDNLDVLDARLFFRLWPIVFILVGLNLLFNKQRRRFTGSAFLTLGLLLLLDNLGYIYFDASDLLPLLLVLLGVRVIQRHRSRDEPLPSDAEPTITASGILGGVERTCSSQDFKGGQLTAFMGGCEIDLREASIASGPAVIDIFCDVGRRGTEGSRRLESDHRDSADSRWGRRPDQGTEGWIGEEPHTEGIRHHGWCRSPELISRHASHTRRSQAVGAVLAGVDSGWRLVYGTDVVGAGDSMDGYRARLGADGGALRICESLPMAVVPRVSLERHTVVAACGLRYRGSRRDVRSLADGRGGLGLPAQSDRVSPGRRKLLCCGLVPSFRLPFPSPVRPGLRSVRAFDRGPLPVDQLRRDAPGRAESSGEPAARAGDRTQGVQSPVGSPLSVQQPEFDQLADRFRYRRRAADVPVAGRVLEDEPGAGESLENTALGGRSRSSSVS